MNIKTLSFVTGLFVLTLGIVGILMGEQLLGGVMNINLALDMVRVVLGGVLIYGGLRSEQAARTAFGVFGVTYLGAFIAGLISPTLFELLPDGIGVLDQGIHLVGGAIGTFLAAYVPRVMTRHA